jgi:hypothetical protein
MKILGVIIAQVVLTLQDRIQYKDLIDGRNWNGILPR